jgi:hypothetical protein
MWKFLQACGVRVNVSGICSSAPNIDHELETLERVSIGAQQRLEHAYAIFAHDPPLLRFFFVIIHGSIGRCVDLHQIRGSMFGIVLTAAFLVAPKSLDIVFRVRFRLDAVE